MMTPSRATSRCHFCHNICFLPAPYAPDTPTCADLSRRGPRNNAASESPPFYSRIRFTLRRRRCAAIYEFSRSFLFAGFSSSHFIFRFHAFLSLLFAQAPNTSFCCSSSPCRYFSLHGFLRLRYCCRFASSPIFFFSSLTGSSFAAHFAD